SERYPAAQDEPFDIEQPAPSLELFQPVRNGAENQVGTHLGKGEIGFRLKVRRGRQHPPAEVKLALFEPQAAEGLLSLLHAVGEPAVAEQRDARSLARLDRRFAVDLELMLAALDAVEERRHP